MSGFLFGANAGTPSNIDGATQTLGWEAGGRTNLAGQTSGSGKGAASTFGAVNAAGWAGFDLLIGPGSGSTVKYAVDIATDEAFTNIIVPDFYVESVQTVNTPTRHFIPLSVPGGVTLYGRMRGSSTSLSLRASLIGYVRDANSRPMFNKMESLTFDSTNLRPHTAGLVPVAAAGSTSFTTLIDPTANAYGALMAIPGHGGTTPALSQDCLFRIATGAASSEAVVGELPSAYIAALAACARSPSLLMQKAFPSGIRVSCQMIAPNVNSDAIKVGLYGFRNV